MSVAWATYYSTIPLLSKFSFSTTWYRKIQDSTTLRWTTHACSDASASVPDAWYMVTYVTELNDSLFEFCNIHGVIELKWLAVVMLSVLPLQVFQLAVCSSSRKNEHSEYCGTRVRNSAFDVRIITCLLLCHSSRVTLPRLCLRHMWLDLLMCSTLLWC